VGVLLVAGDVAGDSASRDETRAKVRSSPDPLDFVEVDLVAGAIRELRRVR
jgi:hypothetical protein